MEGAIQHLEGIVQAGPGAVVFAAFILTVILFAVVNAVGSLFRRS